MSRPDELVVDGPIEELEQGGEEPVDVEEHHRFGEQPELVPREDLQRLVERAEPAGQDDEPGGQISHARLAVVHRGDDLERCHAVVGDLGAARGAR